MAPPMQKGSAHTEILEHEKECREPGGPVFELRTSMAELKSWVRGVGIALVLLQLLSTGNEVARWLSPRAQAGQVAKAQP